MNARTAGQEWGRVHKQRPPAMFGLSPPILENYLITRLHIDKPSSMSDSHISGAEKTDGLESPSLSDEMQLTDPRPASSTHLPSEEAFESEWGEHRKYKDPKTSLARAQIGGVHLAVHLLMSNIKASLDWCKEKNKLTDAWCKAHEFSDPGSSLPAVIIKKLFPPHDSQKEEDATSNLLWQSRSIVHMSASDVQKYVKPLQGSFGLHNDCLPLVLKLEGPLATELPWVDTNWKVLETAAERGAEHLDWGT